LSAAELRLLAAAEVVLQQLLPGAALRLPLLPAEFRLLPEAALRLPLPGVGFRLLPVPAEFRLLPPCELL
jgi:hypothetical protein